MSPGAKKPGPGIIPAQVALLNLHATVVSCAGTGVLIKGPSGSGKSGLALQLMAFGAALVADDLVRVTAVNGRLCAASPGRLPGLIEARGIGILQCDFADPVDLGLVIDLGQVEKNRLPPERTCTILNIRLPLLHKVEADHFPAAILQFLKGGRASV